jgi:undecaprenyl pyrophosphate phosphatase UppP
VSCVLELLAVLAVIVTALAVICGALTPGEALRRVGTALVLLLIVPAILTCIVRTTITPMLSAVVTDLAKAAVILVMVAVVALIGWMALRQVQRRSRTNHREDGEEQ